MSSTTLIWKSKVQFRKLEQQWHENGIFWLNSSQANKAWQRLTFKFRCLNVTINLLFTCGWPSHKPLLDPCALNEALNSYQKYVMNQARILNQIQSWTLTSSSSKGVQVQVSYFMPLSLMFSYIYTQLFSCSYSLPLADLGEIIENEVEALHVYII